MPKLLDRPEPGGHVPRSYLCDALVFEGSDPAAERRSYIRALNDARQRQESQAEARAHLERCWQKVAPAEEED